MTALVFPTSPNPGDTYTSRNQRWRFDGTSWRANAPLAPMPHTVNGRLTLTSGTPITAADVSGATNVYFTPFRGNIVTLWDGAAWVPYTFSELTLALGTLTSGKNYDVFAYQNAGVAALDSPLVWTNDTTRATAVTLQDGRYCKSGDKTRLYLGTFRTTATTTTEDSLGKRFLWNYYNRSPRPLQRLETTASWNYTTATWRQAANSALNQLECVIGIPEESTLVLVSVSAHNAGASCNFSVGIGLDSTSAPTGVFSLGETNGDRSDTLTVHLETLLPVGYHYFAWLEQSQAAGTTTWNGVTSTANFRQQSGMQGRVMA